MSDIRKYIDLIEENSFLLEEPLNEGMLQKLAGLALGTVLALGPKIGQAETIYTFLPGGNTNVMTPVLDKSHIPADARLVLAIDTDTNQVSVVKGSSQGQVVQPDPQFVKQGQQQSTVQSEPKPEPQQAEKKVENQNQTSLVFTGYTMDEIKDKMIEKITSEYPDAEIDDKGRSLVSTRYSVQMKSIGGAFMTALMKGSMGTMDVVTRYNFAKVGNQIKVTPQQYSRFTNAFGQPEMMDNSENVKNIVNFWYKDFQSQ